MRRTLLIHLGHWLQSWGNRLVERYQPTGEIPLTPERQPAPPGTAAAPPHWVALVKDEAPWLLEDYAWPETDAYQTAPGTESQTDPVRRETETGPVAAHAKPSRTETHAAGQAPQPPVSPASAAPLPGRRPPTATAAAHRRGQPQPAPASANPWLRRDEPANSANPASRAERAVLPVAHAAANANRARPGEVPRPHPPATPESEPKPISAKTDAPEPAAAAARQRLESRTPQTQAGGRKQRLLAGARLGAQPAPRPNPVATEPTPNPRPFAGPAQAEGNPVRQNPPAGHRRLIAQAAPPSRPLPTEPPRTGAAQPAHPAAFAHKPPPLARPRLNPAVPAQPVQPRVPESIEAAKPSGWQRQHWPQLPDEAADRAPTQARHWPELPDQQTATGPQPQQYAEPLARELERNRRLAREQRGLAWNE
ncbi:hypothetical protein A1507_07205 [Methylomonas koyamae]|uniref:Uncharacterized protein n=1 Tax=Methylomonas koyamae TaxID=702114 RepID=A0A177NN85_9GAMM|nr:hypothetical protein [Methylomonas koyamae]OAI19341.1 hypothetical protein A1507_07205 [Methylomonas koyamae]